MRYLKDRKGEIYLSKSDLIKALTKTLDDNETGELDKDFLRRIIVWISNILI